MHLLNRLLKTTIFPLRALKKRHPPRLHPKWLRNHETRLKSLLSEQSFAEKEIAYKEAEIHNVRKRSMAEKADLIKFGGMGLARRMLTVLGDVDRAMTGIEDDDQSPVAQGLRLLRNKMWHELQADGVTAIDAKGAEL